MAHKSSAEYIADKLESLGIATVGATSGWAAAISQLPPAPDTVISVVEGDDNGSNAKFALDFDVVHCFVRGAPDGATTASAKGLEIKNKVAGIAPETYGDYRIVGVICTLGPRLYDFDDKRRPIYGLSIQVTRANTSAADTNRTIIA